VQQPHIPLLIGGDGEKVTLRIVAQYADACHMIADPATLEHKFAVLKAHCEAVGRDYQSIRRTASTVCAIGDTDEQALASIPDEEKAQLLNVVKNWIGKSLAQDTSLARGLDQIVAGGRSESVFIGLIGSPETIRKRIAAYEAVGVQELRLHFLDGAQPDTIRRFAEEFIA
jgi:alkanesulfonate monooxygenase SsuD/methylene tetrahydromethanopterin reductase-like flavin-dependent oxidoreductase (luciferase family)